MDEIKEIEAIEVEDSNEYGPVEDYESSDKSNLMSVGAGFVAGAFAMALGKKLYNKLKTKEHKPLKLSFRKRKEAEVIEGEPVEEETKIEVKKETKKESTKKETSKK